MSQQKPVGKYGAMIQKARSQESQDTSSPEDQIDGKPEDQQTSKEEVQQDGKAGSQKEEEVNLSIKVPKRLRRHWVSEAKKRDTSLTAIIIASLKDKLGEPEDT